MLAAQAAQRGSQGKNMRTKGAAAGLRHGAGRHGVCDLVDLSLHGMDSMEIGTCLARTH